MRAIIIFFCHIAHNNHISAQLKALKSTKFANCWSNNWWINKKVVI